MIGCWICLEEVRGGERYHPSCLERLFGRSTCPIVELGTPSLTEAVAKQSDRISISGVQEKLVMDLDDGGTTIRPVENGRYILKIPIPTYTNLPQNEHLTMVLAASSGLSVPVCGLIELPQGDVAYLVKRFDRTDSAPPSKRRQEDFCSLLQRDPTLKYQSSAEECADVVRKYSGDVNGDLRRLFQQFLFAFWIGNDDLHLKNLSLSEGGASGGYLLSMAYDLVCTRLYPQLSKGMALPLDGRNLHHSRKNLVSFAKYCGISDEQAGAEIDRLRGSYLEAIEIVKRSALPSPMKLLYERELGKKNRAIA
jgi:serine/threonine-protein kinase HipA